MSRAHTAGEGERSRWPRLRPLAQADLAAVLALQRATPEASQWQASDYVRLLVPVQTPALNEGVEVAELDFGVAGFIAWRCAEEDCEILNLAVDAAARRQGIGEALLNHVLELARRSGAQRLFLEVRESNRPAQLFYTRHGFLPSGRRPRYYRQPDEDAVVLSRTLESPGSGARSR